MIKIVFPVLSDAPASRAFGAHSIAGFSLVEMLVVLTIIALVLGLVGPRVLSYLGESRSKTAKLQIESFGSSLDLFYLDAGRYPTTSEGLTALVQRPTGIEIWNGPYIKGNRVPARSVGQSLSIPLTGGARSLRNSVLRLGRS